MNRKLVSLVLSGLIVLNSSASLKFVYADSDNKAKSLTKSEDTKSANVVYLANGEGTEGTGNGTEQYPYQNIRTALEKIQDGGILKIKGVVSYDRYKEDTDGAALPLFINKNITIEGENGAELSVRAPIQLGANVTFKNLQLEMVPAVILGRMLGQAKERSATIFVAGHELTLDNVNTRVGTNVDQYNDRPYISGGRYKDQGTLGKKAVINIINPNSETKLSGIYAGDYYKDLNLNVDINIDGNVVLGDKIYTGGHNHTLNGNVTVNLGNKSNVTKFDKSNQNGNLDVSLKNNAYITNFDATGIHDLTLNENTGIILAENATFDVNNVVLKNDARIDFRDMTNSILTVNGNFEGETNINTSRKGGTIFLNNKQTLDITGQLSGTTRLNNRGVEPVDRFVENHVYVQANLNSSGELTIKDSMFDNYQLNSAENDNKKNWTIKRLKEGFGDFKWVGDNNNRIENTAFYVEQSYPIEFTNDEGNVYVPDIDDLYTDFEYTLTKPDGTKLYLDKDEGFSDDGNVYIALGGDGADVKVLVGIYTKNIPKGKLLLTVTNKATQKSISKNIYLVQNTDNITGSVSISGVPIQGRTISADISGLPSNVGDVKYKWYVKDKVSGDEELVTDQTGKDFVLEDKYVNKDIKVVVEAMNYNGTVASEYVTVKSQSTAPTIEGLDSIKINVGDVDKFNKGENLKNVTAKDYNQQPIQNINVLDNVVKPQAGTNKTFKIRYSVTDSEGNTNEQTREVTVTNQNPTISGLTDIFITQGDTYNLQQGVSAQDYEDKTISNITYPTNDLTKLSVGVHNIKYSVTDSDNNTVEQQRRVIVYKKTSSVGPTIQGLDSIELKESQVDEFNKKHKLTGVTVSDDIDSPSAITLSVSGEVGKLSDGQDKTYELTYTATDSDLNKTIQKRTVTVKANKINLSDVKGHWAENNILSFVNQGYINGYEDKTFKPNNSITRAEFIKIVNKVFGYNTKGTENFSDVNPKDWFYNDVCIAVKAGYINGKTPTTFEPNSPITRQEVAKILTTIKNNKNTDYDKLVKFKDGHKVDEWAKPYVEGALDAGYLTGDDKGKLNPTNNITRAEAVTVLIRVKK